MFYLQSRDALADWLRVLSKDAFFIQELAVPPVAGWLEQPVVENIFEALIERAQDPLLGDPHRRIRVEPHAFLLVWGAEGSVEECERGEEANWLTVMKSVSSGSQRNSTRMK